MIDVYKRQPYGNLIAIDKCTTSIYGDIITDMYIASIITYKRMTDRNKDFNQKTHDTDVGSYGGQSRQMTEAVSYTHLDVYKRQGRGCAPAAPCRRCAHSGIRRCV